MWMSSGRLVIAEIAFTTGGPRVMFGTKCPSMMSRCSSSMPFRSKSRTSLSRFRKSEHMSEGAIRTLMASP